MKKLFFYLAGLLLLTAFPACSDDDDPAKEETTGFITKVKVEVISKQNPTPAPLEGVTVTGYDENDKVIVTAQTNAEGVASLEHEISTLYYTLTKEGYSDTDTNGLWVSGVDAEGNYIYVDANADGVIDENDRPWMKYSCYHGDDPEEKVLEEGPHYMIPVE